MFEHKSTATETIQNEQHIRKNMKNQTEHIELKKISSGQHFFRVCECVCVCVCVCVFSL